MQHPLYRGTRWGLEKKVEKHIIIAGVKKVFERVNEMRRGRQRRQKPDAREGGGSGVGGERRTRYTRGRRGISLFSLNQSTRKKKREIFIDLKKGRTFVFKRENRRSFFIRGNIQGP